MASVDVEDEESGPAFKPADGIAIASMVLGIACVLTFWIFPVCALFAAAAFVLGRLAQQRLRHAGVVRTGAKGWATAGIVLSLSGFLLSAALLGSCFFMVNKAADDGQKEFGKAIQELENDPEFKRQVDELRQDLKTLDEQKGEQKVEGKGAPTTEADKEPAKTDAGKLETGKKPGK